MEKFKTFPDTGKTDDIQLEINFDLQKEKELIAKKHHISPSAIEFLTFDGKNWYMKDIPIDDYDKLYEDKGENRRYPN